MDCGQNIRIDCPYRTMGGPWIGPCLCVAEAVRSDRLPPASEPLLAFERMAQADGWVRDDREDAATRKLRLAAWARQELTRMFTEREQALREELIRLGWTPPPAKEQT